MTDVPTTEARVLVAQEAEADRFLPEGPRAVTLDGRAALAWVNIQTSASATGGAIHWRFWDTGERRALPLPARPGFLLPTDRPNVVFVGRDKDLGTLDLATGEWVRYATIPDTNPRSIVNDGEVVPGGLAVVFGTKDVQVKDPIAALYLFTLDDRGVSVLADGQVCSNGKVFRRDGADLLLYDIDTPRRTVARYRLDVARHTAAPDGVVLDVGDVTGFPDGMVWADERSVIIAFFDPGDAAVGRAIRYDLTTGRPLERWTAPGSPRVTCPVLVAQDGRQKLVLTTAVEGMPADQRAACPNAGNLLIADTSLTTPPVPEVLRLTP
jgi:sugar lactone lactonase YvrE